MPARLKRKTATPVKYFEESESDFESELDERIKRRILKKDKQEEEEDIFDDDVADSDFKLNDEESNDEGETVAVDDISYASDDLFEDNPIVQPRRQSSNGAGSRPVAPNRRRQRQVSDSEESESSDGEEAEEEQNRDVNLVLGRYTERGERQYNRMKERLETNMVAWHSTEWEIGWENLAKLNKERMENIKQASQPEELINVSLLPFQKEGLFWMTQQEDKKFNGGILADSMGMGKTIQTISLLVTNKRKTLVICPVVALYQWKEEITKFTNDVFKICIYHGACKTKDKNELEDFDIVLTSYSIVEACFRKEKSGFSRKNKKVFENSVLHEIHWGRIVLDEAHCIKDRSCSTARAVFALQAEKKWSLSGTPLQNRVGELYSLIRFIGVSPFSCYFCTKCPCKLQTWKFSDRKSCDECGHRGMDHFCWWNKIILKPIQRYGPNGHGLEAFKRLGILLDQFMLRRTKEERAEDLGLPPRIVEIRRDYFNDVEEDFYISLYAESRTKFANYVSAGTVLNNYAHIFELLSKLRQAVDHPFLVVHKKASSENPGTYVCGLCHDEAEDPIASKCKHVFCREDMRQYLESYFTEGKSPECPVCFTKININLDQDSLPSPKFEEGNKLDVKSSSIVNRMLNSNIREASPLCYNWTSSTKIEALLEELEKLRSSDRTLKSIIFSQFVSFLDIIYWRLNKAGFKCVKLDGRMTPEQRDAVIKTFMTVPQVTVFLVSLKAGGVALNLTEASRIFILDPWWNPAVEDQAMDRIHRLGQRRPVKIMRLIVENSIESRIIQLQDKKKLLFDSTVGKDSAALERLSLEDLNFLFQM